MALEKIKDLLGWIKKNDLRLDSDTLERLSKHFVNDKGMLVTEPTPYIYIYMVFEFMVEISNPVFWYLLISLLKVFFI